MIRPTVLLALAVLACAPAPGSAPPLLTREQAARGEPCRRAVADYLAVRDAANFCRRDDDCVELTPAPCLPAYHANIATADRGLRAREAALAATCGVATDACTRTALDAPRCADGRCVAGRTIPGDGRRLRRPRRRLSCWFEQEQILELDRPHLLYPYSNPPEWPPDEARLPITEPGELTLTVDMRRCPGEPRFPDIDPAALAHTRVGTVHTYRLPVEPGELALDVRFIDWTTACDHVIVTPHLVRPDGTAVAATHHGIRSAPNCED